MKNVGELLKEADPLGHESAISSEQRHIRRRAVLAAASKAHRSAEKLSWSRATFVVGMASIAIAVLLLAEHAWNPLVRNVDAAVRFEVRLAEDKPGPGLREVKIVGTDRSIYLPDEAVVTNGDISVARVIEVDNAFKIGVGFKAAGAKKMREATEGHLGKPVAVLIDGQVVMAPVLRSPIDKSAEITGNFTKVEAEKIVRGIVTTP